jgi:hypothetical protein
MTHSYNFQNDVYHLMYIFHMSTMYYIIYCVANVTNSYNYINNSAGVGQ